MALLVETMPETAQKRLRANQVSSLILLIREFQSGPRTNPVTTVDNEALTSQRQGARLLSVMLCSMATPVSRSQLHQGPLVIKRQQLGQNLRSGKPADGVESLSEQSRSSEPPAHSSLVLHKPDNYLAGCLLFSQSFIMDCPPICQRG
jgi:hypothetical protein